MRDDEGERTMNATVWVNIHWTGREMREHADGHAFVCRFEFIFGEVTT